MEYQTVKYDGSTQQYNLETWSTETCILKVQILFCELFFAL